MNKQQFLFYILLYSGKFSRENIFVNFANYRLFAKISSANVLFYVDKDRAIALIRENIIHEMLYLAHSRKFSPTKISRYTVYICDLHNRITNNVSLNYLFKLIFKTEQLDSL